MPRKKRTANASGKKFEVLHNGRHAVVVDYGYPILVAHPSEIPKEGGKEYLLRMMDELLAIRDKVLKGDKYIAIHVAAGLKHGGAWYALGVVETDEVPIMPLKYDYEDFIRTADKVEMQALGREADYNPRARRGRYAVVVEDEGGLLYVFGREDVRLEPDRLMLAVIREMMDNFEELTGAWDVDHVALRGLVWRNNAGFFPVVTRDRKVGFMYLKGDYVDFVKGAEGVEFV